MECVSTLAYLDSCRADHSLCWWDRQPTIFIRPLSADYRLWRSFSLDLEFNLSISMPLLSNCTPKQCFRNSETFYTITKSVPLISISSGEMTDVRIYSRLLASDILTVLTLPSLIRQRKMGIVTLHLTFSDQSLQDALSSVQVSIVHTNLLNVHYFPEF